MQYGHNGSSTSSNKVSTGCPTPEPPPTDTCCELICFERPNYFCGHLLTDEDLKLEQKYLREKLKLYHRTLHGSGIVCGLRLVCDHDCPGGILIEEGYAIDDCGNDLVVCETARFDVVGELKKKGLLVEEPPVDPCKPKEEQPECKVRQCFYVTICYQEDKSDFTTPFIAGCRPNLTECEPTRVQETVRFDVVGELPKTADWMENLQERIECCFQLFSKGPFADELKNSEDMIKAIIGGVSDEVYSKDCHDLFCKLRGLLLLYLTKHPDKYNCTIEDEIRKIPFPTIKKEGKGIDGTNCKDAICSLLELAWQHAVSCVFGELIPRCAEPAHASCLVLGTVEVENGKVVHVCNCPRSYVWSFAHFFEVLLATVLGELACDDSDTDEGNRRNRKHDEKHLCCRKFDLDCERFLGPLRVDSAAYSKAGTAPIDAFFMLKKAMRTAFDFTQAGMYSPQMFNGLSVEEAQQRAADLGVSVERVEDEASIKSQFSGLAEAISSIGLFTTGKPLVFAKKDNLISRVFPVRSSVFETPVDDPARISKRVQALEVDLKNKKNELQELKVQLERFLKGGNPDEAPK